MADSLDSGTRPSATRASKTGKTAKKERGNVDVMAYRQANGLDIWTGEPLTGLQRKQWEQTVRDDSDE